MKTLAWGSVPNNVRAWCACNMMANKAAMDNDALTFVDFTVSRAQLEASSDSSSLINGRIISAFSGMTFLKPLWMIVLTGFENSGEDRLKATLISYAPGITDTQVDHLCKHLGRLFGSLASARRYRGLDIESQDFRVTFGSLDDKTSRIHSSRQTINLTLHQIHVEIAKENAAGVQEQIEMPLIDDEVLAKAIEAEEIKTAPIEKPTIKDNWVVGWRLVGTAIKQCATEAFAKATLGKSYTH